MKVLLRTAFFVLLAAFIMLPLAGCKHTHKTYVNAPPRHRVKPAPPRSFAPAPHAPRPCAPAYSRTPEVRQARPRSQTLNY